MKQIRRRALFLVLPVLTAALCSSCELFGLTDDELSSLEINVPEIVQELGELSFPDLQGGLPAGETRWLGTPAIPLDLVKQEPKLEQYRDRIRRIEIRSISYRAVTNSLTKPMPPMEFWFGPASATVRLDESPAKIPGEVKYGATAQIPAGQAQSTRVAIQTTTAAADQVAELMTSLAFHLAAGLTLTDKTPIPQGKVKLEVGLQLTVFVNVL